MAGARARSRAPSWKAELPLASKTRHDTLMASYVLFGQQGDKTARALPVKAVNAMEQMSQSSCDLHQFVQVMSPFEFSNRLAARKQSPSKPIKRALFH